MRDMPLPFELERKGVIEIPAISPSSSSSSSLCKNHKQVLCVSSEPTSVLDTIRSPSPPTSTSTLSSSFGGGGGTSTDTAGVAAVSGSSSQKWQPSPQHHQHAGTNVELQPIPTSLEITGGGVAAEKCGGGLGMEDWEGVLSDTMTASPSQEQSILRWIMGDVDDPSIGLNKLLQTGAQPDSEFAAGFGAVDQGFAFEPVSNPNPNPNFTIHTNARAVSAQNPNLFAPPLEEKPPFFNPQMVINQHQANHTQNPSFFLPLPFSQQPEHHHVLLPPPPKRHHSAAAEQPPPQVFLPHHLSQRQALGNNPKTRVADEMSQHQLQQQQQAIIDQILKVAELVETGNSILAQGILARLNHSLSPVGKPIQRVAFYFKEALQLLLHNSNSAISSPFSLIFKIGAYKSFSEISPLLQFANFTCNQALLESIEGFDRIQIIDFDIGFGGQWASLMQELAMKNGNSSSSPALKITAFVSPSTPEHKLELDLTRENLIHFATEINIQFELEYISVEALNSSSWSLPPCVSENEAIAVNLPVGSSSNYPFSLPLILRFIKQLSPKIVVSTDRGCDRTDLPFSHQILHAIHSYLNLLESLDAVNVNFDVLQKIERFLIQPGIEKIVVGRHRFQEKTPPWRSVFLSCGFSPLTFSNFTESQAECVVKRTPVRGFHVEKRQSALVLCYQRKELISASAWRC